MRWKLVGFALGLLVLVISTGCISVEQEVFLNADGSGEFVIHISLPDFPEELKSKAKDPSSNKDPVAELEKMKMELTTALPPSVKVKDFKTVQQNGVQGFYMVLQFKNLKEMTEVLAKFGKESFKDDIKSQPDWNVELNKVGTKWNYSSSFYVKLDDDKKADKPESKKTADEQQDDKMADDLSKELAPLLMSTVRMRFVLHAPSPITDSNADIVMHENIAVWNCSFAAFVKDKKPIQMRASY